ncbi:MAG: permease [Candidatus Omnitrophota bacterium]
MLRMISAWITEEIFRLPVDSRWGAVLDFFIYDSVKILLLLVGMITAIGFLRSYLPRRRLRDFLSKRAAASYGFAALFGAVTPFCSCSSIPIFIGLLKAGIPIGVNFAFLITSPLINEYLVVLMLGFFGWKITLAYIASGILIGVASGALLQRLRVEKYLVSDFTSAEEDEEEPGFRGLRDRLRFGLEEAFSIVHKIWLWVLVGVGLGSLIHNLVPEEAVQAIIARTGYFSVPIAVLLGVPMYGSCAAILPIAVVLFQKGIPLGTALAFMMAIAALSLPEAVMLRRAMRLPLIGIFFAVTTLAIILTGYLLNWLQGFLVR